MGASSPKVRASMPMRSPTIDSVAPLLARGHAPEGLSQHLALRARKSGPHARTPSSHERRASPCPARWQVASFWRSGRIWRKSGVTRAPCRAPVSIPSILSCCGVILRWCEVGLSGLTAVVYGHTRGPASVSSVSPPHGLGTCTWRRSQTFKMTSAFNICRPGDAVVSTRRETRLQYQHLRRSAEIR